MGRNCCKGKCFYFQDRKYPKSFSLQRVSLLFMKINLITENDQCLKWHILKHFWQLIFFHLSPFFHHIIFCRNYISSLLIKKWLSQKKSFLANWNKWFACREQSFYFLLNWPIVIIVMINNQHISVTFQSLSKSFRTF